MSAATRSVPLRLLLLLILLLPATPLQADIRQSVLRLLTELSRDYLQQRGQPFFKIPLAVVPFIDSSELARQHEVAAVVDALIRSEITASTYFLLTERENLEEILAEIELSLSDLADTSRAVQVGQLTSARVLLAGSVTETGDDFLLNGRLIDVESGVVIGARSLPVAKEELISEARAFKYEYVTRYGLGLLALAGMDIPISGIPRQGSLRALPSLVHAAAGVSYRPWRFLQLAAAMNVTWTELQYGPFDPTAPDYQNTSWLTTYYTLAAPGSGLPSYSVEYSQRYLDLLGYYVLQPLKKLTLSLGGGGLLGMYRNYIKINSFPVYIGPFISGLPDPLYIDDPDYWLPRNFVIQGGNALLYGVQVAFKVEYFLSPRLLLFAVLQYRKVFATLAYRYTFGGIAVEEDEPFYELSGWIPGITPYGDDLDIGFHTLGIYLGISGSF